MRSRYNKWHGYVAAKGELQISLIRVSCLATEAYATKFIEMILMVTADHGPAVSGSSSPAAESMAVPCKAKISCPLFAAAC